MLLAPLLPAWIAWCVGGLALAWALAGATAAILWLLQLPHGRGSAHL